MSAAANFQSSTMLRLYRAREEGDYSLTCRGATVKAHSYVLANSTIYFERAMATEVGEGGRLGMEVGDCEPATLETAVAFMYGVEVPEEFPDLQGLLGLADRFLLEELKEEAARRIAQHIDAQNFRAICEMADLHKVKALAVACAKFMLTKEQADCEWLQQLPVVVIAVAEEINLARKEINLARKEITEHNHEITKHTHHAITSYLNDITMYYHEITEHNREITAHNHEITEKFNEIKHYHELMLQLA